jgi:hypothetical protein
MSVIGRLDEQVNKILIEPLSESARDEDRTTPGREPEGASRSASPVESPNEDETTAKDDELPVWLL